MKKSLAIGLMVLSTSVFAAQNSSAPVLNKPTYGGRQQGSEQQFGNQKLTGKPGQRYNSSASDSGNKNKATVGGRQQSSEQQFGYVPLTGKKGQKYNTSGQIRENKPTVGGRQQSSEQQFGNPGTIQY